MEPELTVMILIVLLYVGLGGGVLLGYVLGRGFGMHVTELRLGAGPTLACWVNSSGVKVSLAPLPGGALRVRGWRRSLDEHVTYVEAHGRRHLGKRALVALALPLTVLFTSSALIAVYTRLQPTDELALPLEVGTVDLDGVAERAGLLPGDRLERLAGRPVRNVEALVGAINACGTEPCDFVVSRHGQRLSLSITAPKESVRRTRKGNLVRTSSSKPDFDFSLAHLHRQRSWMEALHSGPLRAIELAQGQVELLFSLGTGGPRAPAIEAAGHEAADHPDGWGNLLNTALVLNAVWMIQLLPWPGLCGGVLLLLALEAVRGRQLAPAAERRTLRIAFLASALPLLLAFVRVFVR